jgi:hypothetical protein
LRIDVTNPEVRGKSDPFETTPIQGGSGAEAYAGLKSWAILSSPFGRKNWLLVAICAVYTAHVIQWSIRFGRLAMDPVYDDVGYFLDALNRLNIFQTSGIRALCDSLVQTPPHSPYSTLAAMVTFDLFGVHDWAPYISNGFVLFIFLLVAAYSIDLPDGITKSAIVLTLLMLQLPFQGMLQFRPDFPLAVFTAACVALLLKEGCWPSLGRSGLYRQFAIGLLGSCALITKPPFAPLTIVLLASAFGMAEIFRFALNREDRALVPIVWRCFAFWTGVALLAGPLFCLTWREVTGYIAVNTGTGQDTSLWKASGGFMGSLTSRVRGWPAYLTFGPLEAPLTLWLGIGLVAQLYLRRWRSLLFSGGILLLAGVSLLSIAAVGMTDPNFSLGWEAIFALAAVISVGELGKLPHGEIAVGCYVAMMAFIFYKAGPPHQVWDVIEDAAKGHSLNQAVVTSISELAPSKSRPKEVFLTFVGGVNAASQNWLSTVQHLGIQADDRHRTKNPEEVLKQAAGADFVEVADPASIWFSSWIPINRSQAFFLERMRADDSFEEVRSFAGTGGTVYLFRRRAAPQ